MDDEEKPYEVRWSSDLGRYLVASRDVKAREIIIREDPLISGPSDRGSKDFPVCLGCLGVMQAEPMKRCTTCRWPVCSEQCEKLPSHASNECQIFRRNRVMYPPPNGWPYLSKSIVILRCLVMQYRKPEAYQRLMNMSDNKEYRKGRPNCINGDKKILENFQKFFPLSSTGASGQEDSQNMKVSEEEVIRISGIIDVNAHAFPLKVGGHSTYVCNLYSETSLIAHSCTPNASWSPDKSLSTLTLTIRANTPIGKGQMISVAYDEGQLLVCTLKRLIPNELNGMFICKCERCRDPCELGTYIGALKCPSCSKGYLLPIDPLDSFSSWKCDDGFSMMVMVDREKDFSSSSTLGTKNESSDDNERGNWVTQCNVILDDESILEIMQDAEETCGYTKMDLGTSPSSERDHDDHDVDVEGNPEDPDEMLELLKEFVKDYAGTILHPNHYILQEVNVRILKREYNKVLSTLGDMELIQYLERCERLLKISNILTPGFCEYRAFLHYHLCQGLLSLERRKESRKAMTRQKQKQEQLEKRKCDSGKEMLNESENKGAGCSTNSSSAAAADNNDRNDHVVFHGNNVKQESTKASGLPDKSDYYDATTTTTSPSSCDRGGADDDDDVVDDNDQSPSGKTMKYYCFEGTQYENSLKNLEHILEMLTFLLTFFKELNPSHKLLKPISETIIETEGKVELLLRGKVGSEADSQLL